MTLVSLSLVLKDRTLNLNKKRERKRLFSCILMKRAINQCSINSEKMSVLGLMIPPVLAPSCCNLFKPMLKTRSGERESKFLLSNQKLSDYLSMFYFRHSWSRLMRFYFRSLPRPNDVKLNRPAVFWLR